jgi:hypothetical protein
VAALCAAPHGTAWAPPTFADPDRAAIEVRDFLRGEKYKALGWLHDASWRLTGPFEGCACPEGTPAGSCDAGVSKGPHPAVRVYYSPEVVAWMCTHRRGEAELPGAPEMPDGAMIIKEMLSPAATRLALVPGTDKLWIAPIPGLPADYYDRKFDSWTVMLKERAGSADGWFWAFYDKTTPANPPIWDRCAFTKQPYPGMNGAPVTSPPGCDWLPTYWQYSVNDQQYPNAQSGNYCVYCHASTQGQSTFASFVNLMGNEIEYAWSPSTTAKQEVDAHTHEVRRAHKASPEADAGPGIPTSKAPATTPLAAASTNQCPKSPFPLPEASPLPGWQAAFPELSPSYQEIWNTRMPSHTYDHAISKLGVAGANPAASQYLTSDQCEGCHEAGGAGQLATPHMVERVVRDGGEQQIDLAPWAEWSVSPMGLAGRDPVFHSQLELERNIARGQPGLANIRDCIDNTCLHCHGGAGARQYNIDTAGQGPKGDPCAAFLPQPAERRAADYDGKLFTAKMVDAWRDEDPANARYGALARDGINCSMCHHIADRDLDQKNLPKTFTGNFRVGPPDRLYGPFPNAASPDEIRTKPMVAALGITPEVGPQIAGSEMCGTCHTVFLPVFDDAGRLAGTSYEQTTYLEWLLSDSSTRKPGGGGRSCQDCHMPHDYRGKPLQTGIANVQGTAYPAADFLLPAKEVDLPSRPYRRHKMYGLNVFLNAYAQQYPLLLGIRQQDYMNPNVTAPLVTGLESALEVARDETAEVTVGAPAWRGDELTAQVTVRNLGGHSLPSGVGFRRAFLEVAVLGAADEVLWASGRTNAVGMILAGRTEAPLPTELLKPGRDGLPFQAHRQVVTDEDQAQIYEEINQTSSLQISSSFLHRYWTLKDNRLRPTGWDPAKVADPALREQYAEATQPGTGPERHWWPKPKQPMRYRNPASPAIERYTDTLRDPDYERAAHPKTGLPGSDQVTYRMRLSPEDRRAARRVRVTLYSQSTPPYFLKERFAAAAAPGAERSAAQRMYYISGHLNTAAKAPDGTPYLSGYRLQVGRAAYGTVPASP